MYSLHNCIITDSTSGNRVYGKIVNCPRLRMNHGKFRFKYISRNQFVSIINDRNTRKRKLIGESKRTLNK